ncbi:MAG: efflux RND transporter periplasmic adaptor subunit, partial [Muribaculaceae bacterium]|nr:efflux RND transporter periplasmic adaptor subunit [Muribaculaceae bacterium]
MKLFRRSNNLKLASSPVLNRTNAVSRKKKSWIVIIILLLIIVAVVYIVTRPKQLEVTYPTVEVVGVDTTTVSVYGEYVGRIRAQQFVEVHARVEGYLERMMFKEGAYVERGQTLFIIDPRVYEAHVNRARAQLNKAKAQAQKADRDLKRIRPLYEQNAASQLDLDNAIAAAESANAEVTVAQADLTQAELILSYTRVTSPRSGYISERVADIGKRG